MELFLGVIYKDLQKLDCSKNPISVTWGILLLWPTLIDGLHIGKEVANKKKANSIWFCETVTAKTKLEKGSVNSEVKRKIVIEFRSWDSSNEIQFSIRPSENFLFSIMLYYLSNSFNWPGSFSVSFCNCKEKLVWLPAGLLQ